MNEFDRLVSEMESQVDSLVNSTLEQVGQRYPSWAAETAFSREQVSEFARAGIRAHLRSFRRGKLPEKCPHPLELAARAAARAGETEALSSGYRAGQAALWRAWFGLIEDSGLEGEERRELLHRGSDFFFAYADLLAGFIATIHQEEMSQTQGSSSHRRLHAAKDLLEGDPASADAIDFDLRRHHLGLIAWGAGGEEAIRQVAAQLGRPFLSVAPLPEVRWGWISGTRPLSDRERREIARLKPPTDCGLALGLDEYGEPGFRTTHRQAQRARLLAPADTPSLTLYADVAIEALGSENLKEAHNFVARELAGLEDDSTASARIRETLAAYFAAELNAASAAAALGVHQQTVSNRLRAAEERLGHRIGARRVEIEVALRLREAFLRGGY